tara:strand:- start:321 stop:938 length:618 start_codon:yes stop_codon:yes gene_type:complete
MFNPKIKEGPIHFEPWPWLQVDNVIDDFDNLREDFKQYSPVHNEELTGREGTMSVVMKNGDERLTPKLQEFVANAETWLEEHTEEILSNWHGLGIGRETKVDVQITRQLPSPYRFHIHQESDQKHWTAVIYAQPDYGSGTGLYTGPTLDKRWGQATWKPNRAFIFQRIDGKTWHDYEGIINESRVTINLFIMKPKKNKQQFYKKK